MKVKLFNMPVYCGSYSTILEEFLNNARQRTSCYAVFMNSHMVHETQKKQEYHQVVSGAKWICPDGMPLVYAVRSIKRKQTDRIAGNDVIVSLLEEADKESFKVVFYGSTDEVLDRIREKIDVKYPNVLPKFISPPFGRLSEEQFQQYTNEINDFEPNIVFVGLGCPKQETWMANMKDKIKAPMFGVGGAFLLFAEIDKRAPKWLRNLALEWAYRLVLEPKRLWKRYLITNFAFIFYVIRELFKPNKTQL